MMKLFIIEKETTRYSGKGGIKKIPKSPKFPNYLNFRHLGVLAFRHLLYGVFRGYPYS